MLQDIIASGAWVSYSCMLIMSLATLVYVMLDGHDLGVGILTCVAPSTERDQMIEGIGPFWDANETWLMLSVGILLIAFPKAYGLIFSALSIPLGVMLFSLIARVIAFEMRIKALFGSKLLWDRVFFLGSLSAAGAQGYMLGFYCLGFATDWISILFASLVSLAFIVSYSLQGACRLIFTTNLLLKRKAIHWAQCSLVITSVCIMVVSISTPLVSERLLAQWFDLPMLWYLLPLPLLTMAAISLLWWRLYELSHTQTHHYHSDKQPFFLVLLVFFFCFCGLAYSFFPYIVPEQVRIVDAIGTNHSLKVFVIGLLVGFPILLIYTLFNYGLFRSKQSVTED